MSYTKDLYEMCETLSGELTDMNEKIKSAGGKMSAGDLEAIDKLTHAIKSIKTTLAMMEEEEGSSGFYPRYMYEGGSNRGGSSNGGGSYEGGSYDGGSYRGGSYRGGSYRGGRSYARRDSRGRYSNERGYSRNDLADKMRELMEDAPDDRTRQEMERMVSKLENA